MAEQVLDTYVTKFRADTDQASVSRTRRAFDSIRAGINRLAFQLGIAGTAITAATTGFLKSFAYIQTEYAKIEGLVGISASVIRDKFAPAIRALAVDSGVLPQKLAEGMFFITSAGQRGAEAIRTLTISAKAQAAQLGETNIIADLLTSAMNAYGAANLSAADAADQLAMGVRLGKLEAASLAPVMGTLLPVASKLGVEFREIVGLMAAQSRTGTDAAIGATQLNSVMSDLIKTSEKGEKAIREKLGMSMQDVRDKIEKDGLLSVLTMLDEAFNSNVEELALVFDNVRALRSVLDLLGENADTTTEILDGMADSTGALTEAYEAQTRTINFQFNRAQAAVRVGLNLIGAAMAPVVGALLDKAIPVIKDLSVRFEELPDPIKRVVGWLALLGPLFLVLAAVLPVISAGLGAIGVAAGAILSPVGLTLAALAGLAWGAWALWGPQITEAWEGVKTAFVDPVIAEVRRQWKGPSWETLKAAWEGKTLQPVIASIVPELDEDEQTWAAVGAALWTRLQNVSKFTAVLLFPELDETEVTWSKVWTAVGGRITAGASFLALKLFPELAEDEVTWAAVWTAVGGKITSGAQNLALKLFPELKDEAQLWTDVASDAQAKLTEFGVVPDLLLSPQLDESSVTWMAVWTALRTRITNSGRWLALKLFPELDEDEVTWAAVWTAVGGKITSGAQNLALKLFPELKDEAQLWTDVASDAQAKLTEFGVVPDLLLSPQLDESSVTWMAVWTALRTRITNSGRWLALKLFPELDEDEVTWAAVWTAVGGKITSGAQNLALKLFPELKDEAQLWTDVASDAQAKLTEFGVVPDLLLSPQLDESSVTWMAVWTAVGGKITSGAQNLALKLFPELKDEAQLWTDVASDAQAKLTEFGVVPDLLLSPQLDESSVTWMAVWTALRTRITNSGRWLALKLFPELDEDEVTWASVRTAVTNQVTALSDALIAVIIPTFGLSEERADALKKEWQDWAGSFLALNIDIRLGFLEAISTFLSEVQNQGGNEAVRDLFEALSSLFGAMFNLGSAIAEIQFALITAPLTAMVVAIGGYDNEDGDALVKFLKNIAVWTAGAFVQELNETIAVINAAAEAIEYLAGVVGLVPGGALAFLQGLANPDSLTQQELDAMERGGPDAATDALMSGSGRLVGRLLGRSDLSTEERREVFRNQAAQASGATIYAEPGGPSAVDISYDRGWTSSPIGGPAAARAAIREQRGEEEAAAPFWSRWFNIPGQAEGGVAMRPALRWVGEGEHPEAILPLNHNFGQVLSSLLGIPAIAPAAGMAGGGDRYYTFEISTNVEVTGKDAADPDKIAEKVSEETARQWRNLVDDVDSEEIS